MNILIGSLAALGYDFAVIFGVGLLKMKKVLSLEDSRKVIHILLCFTWTILHHFMAGSWGILIVPVIFIAVNAASYKFHLLKMIEREGEDNHKGTIYFAVSMTLLLACATLLPQTLPLSGLGVFCLTLGDGFAAVVGQKVKSPTIVGSKTLAGTAACFVFSLLGMVLTNFMVPTGLAFWKLLILALVSAGAELVGNRMDNFSVPLLVYAAAIFLS